MSLKSLYLTLFLVLPLFATESSYTLQGSKWLGLSFNISSVRAYGGDYSLNSIQLNSITRFYPADHFILGPSFTFSRISDGDGLDRVSMSNYDIGIDIGFSKIINNRVIPYFIINPELSLYTDRVDGESAGEPTFKAEAKAGCIILINQYVGIQLEPNYLAHPIEELYSLGFDVGFTFMLDKKMLSMGGSTRSLISEIFLW